MPDDSELTVRVYHPNERFYHSVAADVSLTVYDLLPALHKRIWTGDNKTSRLFLKERGKGKRVHQLLLQMLTPQENGCWMSGNYLSTSYVVEW